MEINQTTSAATGTQSSARGTTDGGTDGGTDVTGAIGGDFQTFLTLLTTQMRNQDPLKPMDSTEFVAQLASFSAVEQQVRTNDRLQSILDVLSVGSPAGLAEWIGREVQVAAAADYAGTPLEVAVEPADGAERGVLVVTNDFGNEVARLPVAADARDVVWDGKDAMGTSAPHGSYTFTLESYAGDNLLGTTAGKIFRRVDEVRLVDGAPRLVVAGGTQIPLDEVGAVR
ncbi:MAG TPA: flagellar hook capping FlgD N-terminal domain-containing protein [Amaricoccus sp.]|uniref:flagellar hook capping FlgD N-terminal domain-containing protein n=1 Tax=Amaricoccus sp. TaxID=1872485 RepID=UPI002CDC6633|nr:flagellar hook capping FlgD N-terminal domain-containing protein [Amaricoccus sp.]HRO10978.1 flagellar hook capping FlgD N-terminal domain-containing protein [Amaricoccus sp.]